MLELLNNYDQTHIENPGRNIPLDLFMRYYFLKHKADYDSEARNQIVDLVYTL